MANCIRVQVLRKVEKLWFNAESQFSNIFFLNMQSHIWSLSFLHIFLFLFHFYDKISFSWLFCRLFLFGSVSQPLFDPSRHCLYLKLNKMVSEVQRGVPVVEKYCVELNSSLDFSLQWETLIPPNTSFFRT